MKRNHLAAPYIVWMALFTVIPLGIVLYYAFTDSITGAFTLANLAGMTPTAFSRFFHLHTHKTVSEYTIDIRLGHATRMLVDSTHSVAEICYACGFNNISNFNRIFKKKKGCSPTIFRENYHKSKIII